MYHHSLITMKTTLKDKLKKVRFVEHASGTDQLCSKGLTYANICNFAETWYQESKGVGKWPPATHAKNSKAPPSSFTEAEVHALVQHFQKGQPTSHPQDKSNDTCNLCSKKGHWVNKCLSKAHFTTKPCSDQWTLFRTFTMSWMWKFMQELWTLPRRMRRTTGKQTRLEIQSSD